MIIACWGGLFQGFGSFGFCWNDYWNLIGQLIFFVKIEWGLGLRVLSHFKQVQVL
jgi:hypothetical protein